MIRSIVAAIVSCSERISWATPALRQVATACVNASLAAFASFFSTSHEEGMSSSPSRRHSVTGFCTFKTTRLGEVFLRRHHRVINHCGEGGHFGAAVCNVDRRDWHAFDPCREG